jgi:diaminopimelate decarboxylase
MKIRNKILEFINNKNIEEFDPYYIYEEQTIKDHCKIFQNLIYKNKAIHFATMANINPTFLQIVKNEKVNIFVNSVLHLNIALNVGFKGQDIIFTSSAMTKKTMKYAEEFNVQLNLDSPNQLNQWLTLFPDKAVGIRCNIGDKVKPYSNHAGTFIGKESRLGFTREEISQIGDKSKIKGLHLYAGTDIFDIDYLINCYKELIAIANDFSELEYLNFGGGFGVSENGEKQFNFSEFNSRVSELMNQVSIQKNKSIKLILEPGRIIGGEAGYFVCTVTDVKPRGDKHFVGVNASTVQFSRPLLYADTAKHPVCIIREGLQIVSEKKNTTTIYGCSTYSRDIFSNNIALPELKIGDIIVFANAGSYSASSHMHFLGFPKPEEFFI